MADPRPAPPDRPEGLLLALIADVAAAKLPLRRHHGSWLDCDPLELAAWLEDELTELLEAISLPDNADHVRSEAADVILLAGMLAMTYLHREGEL